MSAGHYRVNRPDAGAAPVSELWRFRELLRSLVVRNLKVKYQRSFLGFLWTLINPLLTAGVLILVFSVVVRIDLEAYWAFLISGYFVWNYIAQNVNAGTMLLLEHAALRKSIAFPAELLVFGSAISRLVEFAIELGMVMIVLAIFHHETIPLSFLVVPVLILILFMVAVGLTMAIAVVSAFYHDVQHVVPILLLTLFYLSPVFYPLSFVPEALQPYFNLNPFAALLTLFHTALYEGRFPQSGVLVLAGAWASGLLLFGNFLFNRYKSILAEIV
jgi:ABC-type polysaccharide/polyol phosphate export permease